MNDTYTKAPETSISFLDYYARHKLPLFPIPHGRKEDPGWKDGTGIIKHFCKDWSRDPSQWAAWYAEHKCNFGLVAIPDHLIIVDIDVGEVGRDAAWGHWVAWCRSHGLNPADYMPQFQSAKQGWHIIFVEPTDNLIRLRQVPVVGAIEGVCRKPIVESRFGNGYVVAAGSTFEGKPYVQLNDNAPYVAPVALLTALGRTARSSGPSKPGQYDFEQVRELYEWMTERGAFESYDDWVRAGMVAKAEFEDRGFELWQITNNGTASADLEQRKFDSFKREGVTLMSLTKRAHEMGWKGGSIQRTAAAQFAGVAQMASPTARTRRVAALPDSKAWHHGRMDQYCRVAGSVHRSDAGRRR
jgi:hypothetical protein